MMNCSNYKQEILEYEKKRNKKRYEYIKVEILEEKEEEKIICECGSIIKKSDVAKHFRSKKHQNKI